jgi:methionyl-tRNA formyltransferase
MRIVIMGTGPFAVPACKQILADGHKIPLVITRPVIAAPGNKLPPRPVFDWARESQLEIAEPASINSPQAIQQLAECSPDLLFVCDYGQILSKECLQVAPLGGINLHGSLLPRHRGAAPVQWSLLSGDTMAGVTVIHMTAKLDAGPAIAVEATQVLPDETAEFLEPRLAELGVRATQRALLLLESWDQVSTLGDLQDSTQVSRAPRFAKTDGLLDFRLPAEYLVRLVRACQPWPGTFAQLKWDSGKAIRLIVRAARYVAEIPQLPALSPGAVVAIDAQQLGVDWSKPWKKMLAVGTRRGIFLIGQLQPAGKRSMDAEEFLRGHPVDFQAKFELPEHHPRALVPCPD